MCNATRRTRLYYVSLTWAEPRRTRRGTDTRKREPTRTAVSSDQNRRGEAPTIEDVETFSDDT